MEVISLTTIQAKAVDAADAGRPMQEACSWPAESEAAAIFNAAYQKRAQQLELMKEVA